nr:hypothetical protein [Desulfobacteraceae bacterium]
DFSASLISALCEKGAEMSNVTFPDYRTLFNNHENPMIQTRLTTARLLNSPEASRLPETNTALIKNCNEKNHVSGKKANKLFLQKRVGIRKKRRCAMTKIIIDRNSAWEDGCPEDFKIYDSTHLKDKFMWKKEYIKRSKTDRRSFLDRRIMNFGPDCPDRDRRVKRDRRKGWDDRSEPQLFTWWDSLPQKSPLRARRLKQPKI